MSLPGKDRGTLSKAERRAVDEADEWPARNQPIRHEDVLADFGLSLADWEKMSLQTCSEKTAEGDPG